MRGSQSALWDGRIFQGCRLAPTPIRSPPRSLLGPKGFAALMAVQRQAKEQREEKEEMVEGEELGQSRKARR